MKNGVMMTMTHNSTCPCCRAPLVDQPTIQEDDDNDSDYNENDEDDDDDDRPEYRWPSASLTVPIEDLAEKLKKEGFTFLDMVSLYTNHFSSINPVYTNLHIQDLYKKCDSIIGEMDNETKETAFDRKSKNEQM